ncbi:unnamed protein product, partial [Sphacelaria rigidula]
MRACLPLNSGEASEWFNVNQGLRQGCVVFPALFSIFFAAALTVTFERFSMNEAVAQHLIRSVERGGKARDELSKVLWAMLTTTTLTWPRDLKEAVMTIVVEVCAAFGLVVTEKKTFTMRTRSPNMQADVAEVEAVCQRYKQVAAFLYLRRKISSTGDATPEIHSRSGQAWACFYKHSRAVYDNPYIALVTKVRLLKTDVIEVMLYGCVIWTIAHENFGTSWETHRETLLRCLNKYTSSRSAPDYHMLPYHEVLERIGCECIEATMVRRILLHAGHVVRMHDERLPNIVMRGVVVGGKAKADRSARGLQHCSTEHCSKFRIHAAKVAQDVSEWYRIVAEGAKMY